MYPAKFKGQLAHPTTKFVGVPISPDGRLGLDIAWKDATSSATITLETTSFSAQDAPVEAAGDAWEWKTESGVTIAGPTGAGAGSTKVHVSNLAARRARLKIVTAANCDFEIHADA